MLSCKALIVRENGIRYGIEAACDRGSWLKSAPWKDARHLQTLAWMIVGWLSSRHVALTKWTSYVISRAQWAQSTQRRFERWLHNRRIPVLHLYGVLLQQALADFRDRRVYLALDTTVLWDSYCVVYISVVYRGRMIPLAWKVMAHGSASVAFKDYRSLLVFLEPRLAAYETYVLADRSFVHRELMRWVKRRQRWHFRIRYKSGMACMAGREGGTGVCTGR